MPPTQAGQSFLDTMTPQPGQYPAQRETPVRKRRRTINSCAGCRKRKSRCDRGQPCSECVANATLEMCQYLESAAKPRNVAVSALQNVLARLPAQAGPSQTTAEVLQSRELVSQDQDLATRVSQLENILRTQMSLLTQPQPATVQDIRQPTHPNTPPETAIVPETSPPANEVSFRSTGGLPDTLQGKDGRATKFVSGRHWTSLLHLFSELHVLRRRPKNDPLFQSMSHALDRFRCRVPRLQPVPLSILVPSLSIDIALRALLPPKSVLKSLVDLYLGTFEKLHRILHVPIFLHQIDYFWKAPDTADLNLTATLIAVLRLGLLLRPQNGDPSVYGSPEWTYRMETQSMQLVELFLHFTTHGSRPSLEILQTQCLVVLCRKTDGSKPYTPWKLVGELLQMGIFMGLNHDPSLFPNTVSLYDGEMRRRIWTTILELHNHVSRTSCLPFPVNSSQYNTQRPLNINDMSIIPCSTEMPVEENWQNITDTSFQHVLSGSLALRLQLEATTAGNTTDETPALGEHCIECKLRKVLRPVNSPFDVRHTVTGPPNLHTLQRVLLEMVAESSFLNARQISFPSPTGHGQELLNDCCRAILKLHQDPELDLASRFVVARWFRCDIVTAIILLLLSIRASRTRVRELSIPWKLDSNQEAATMQLIESSLLLFAQPWQPAWNEVKEQDLLIILLSTVKANGMNEAVRLHLEDNMQRFEPQIPEQSFQHYPTSGSDVQNSSASGSTDAQFQYPEINASGGESFADDGMNTLFSFDTFMSDFGLDIDF